MKAPIIAIAVATVVSVVTFSVTARAGLTFNGTSLNGFAVNGFAVNGTSMNGVSFNRMAQNKIQVENGQLVAKIIVQR